MNNLAMVNESSTWVKAQEAEADYWQSTVPGLSNMVSLLNYLSYLSSAFDSIASNLKDKNIEKALEIGVGPAGIGTLPFLVKEATIWGVDPLPKMEFACADQDLNTYVKTLINRVNYRQVPGERLPFEDQSFDLVTSLNVLDHCDNPLTVLKEGIRVLKPGGYFLLGVDTFSLVGRLKFETWRRLSPRMFIFRAHPHSFLHHQLHAQLIAFDMNIIAEEKPPKPILGHHFVSKWLMAKSRTLPDV